VSEAQAKFKSDFYGYGAAGVQGWRDLQQAGGAVRAADFLPWLRGPGAEERFAGTMVDFVGNSPTEVGGGVRVVQPGVSTPPPPAAAVDDDPACTRTAMVDAVTFQIGAEGGIGRVWSEVLGRLGGEESGLCFLVVVRGGEEEVREVRRRTGASAGPRMRFVTAPLFNEDGDYLRDSLWLASIAKEGGADIFISTQYVASEGDCRSPQALTLEIARRYTVLHPESAPGIPSVVLAHDFTPEMFGWDREEGKDGRKWRLKRQAVEAAAAVVGVSAATMKRMEEVYRLPQDVRRVASSNGVDLSVFNMGGAGAEVEGDYLLMVGQRGGYKSGHTVFMTLAAMCKADMYCPKLVLVGGGEVTEEERGWLGGAVEAVQMGRVDDGELAALYRGAVALVMLSVDEGFGLPVVEAMACGCSVVVSDIEVFREVVGDAVKSERVEFVNPALMEDISQAIIRMGERRGAGGGEVLEKAARRFGDGWERLGRDIARELARAV
jgi:glycosyltransferase involved in cell wall biosynthesis